MHHRPVRSRWNPARRACLAAGSCLWLAAAAGVALWALASHDAATPLERALEFAVAEPRTVAADLPSGRLSPGDRVLRLRHGAIQACGEVLRVEGPVGGATATLALYPDAGLPDPLPPGTRLVRLDAHATLEWALGRVLSPERRERLTAELRTMATESQERLRDALGPVLAEFARGVAGDILADLSGFVGTHEEQLRRVGLDVLARARARWEPLLRERVWPLVVDRLRPLAERLGDELWNELPWGEIAASAAQSLGGAVANVFLPSEYRLPTDQIRRWRDRYLAETAVPKVASYLPEALEAVGEVLGEMLEDERVGQALRDTLFRDALGDPRVMGLLAQAFSTAVLDNPRLRERLRGLFDDPRLRRALFDLAEQIEPRAVAFARTLVLDETRGALHPELAMLVRVRRIGSEGNWVLLELPDAEPTAAGAPRDTGPTAAGTVGATRLRIEDYPSSRTEIWERPLP